MTKLDALRRLLAMPRVEPDLGRIGKRWGRDKHGQIADRPDGRERLSMVYRVLNFRRKAS